MRIAQFNTQDCLIIFNWTVLPLPALQTTLPNANEPARVPCRRRPASSPRPTPRGTAPSSTTAPWSRTARTSSRRRPSRSGDDERVGQIRIRGGRDIERRSFGGQQSGFFKLKMRVRLIATMLMVILKTNRDDINGYSEVK